MEPLNRRIKAHILRMIDRGEWKPGERVPSEAELGSLFGASRMTVNRAVRELTDQGFLARSQGLGTFVAEQTTSAALFEIRSIRSEILAAGGEPRCDVLVLKRVEIDQKTSEVSGFRAKEHAFHLRAVHRNGSKPVQVENRFVSAYFAPVFMEQDFTQTTASDYLVANVEYTDVEHIVQAIPATAEVATALDLQPGAPCLQLTRRTRLNGHLITYVELIHRGDTFRLLGRFAGGNAARRAAS